VKDGELKFPKSENWFSLEEVQIPKSMGDRERGLGTPKVIMCQGAQPISEFELKGKKYWVKANV